MGREQEKIQKEGGDVCIRSTVLQKKFKKSSLINIGVVL